MPKIKKPKLRNIKANIIQTRPNKQVNINVK